MIHSDLHPFLLLPPLHRPMTLHDYQHWIALAWRYARVADEAEDLLQDALLVAAQHDRLDFSVEDNRRWLTGVLRNLAAQTARSALRRRRREHHAADESQSQASESSAVHTFPAWLEHLPPAARRVLVLVLHGLQPIEIQTALGLSSTAYRQRLTSLRKHLGVLPDDLQRDALALAYSRRNARGDDLALGLIRRALLRRLRDETTSSVGTHDPDGHLIVLSGR